MSYDLDIAEIAADFWLEWFFTLHGLAKKKLARRPGVRTLQEGKVHGFSVFILNGLDSDLRWHISARTCKSSEL